MIAIALAALVAFLVGVGSFALLLLAAMAEDQR